MSFLSPVVCLWSPVTHTVFFFYTKLYKCLCRSDIIKKIHIKWCHIRKWCDRVRLCNAEGIKYGRVTPEARAPLFSPTWRILVYETERRRRGETKPSIKAAAWTRKQFRLSQKHGARTEASLNDRTLDGSGEETARQRDFYSWID